MNRFTDEKVMKGYALACADLIDRGHVDLAVSLLRHEAEINFEELSKLDLPRYDYQSLYEAWISSGGDATRAGDAEARI